VILFQRHERKSGTPGEDNLHDEQLNPPRGIINREELQYPPKEITSVTSVCNGAVRPS